jgi:hypothetical protein
MNALHQLEAALSRWENEGGPRACTLPPDYVVQLAFCGTMNTELEHLHVRMIAMENLLITLLTQATDGQRDLCREMASYISPPARLHRAFQNAGGGSANAPACRARRTFAGRGRG